MQAVRKAGVPVALCLLFSVWEVTSDTYYTSYYGKSLNSTEVAAYTSNGTLANCTNLVATCNSSEPRRIDGSCNNLKRPTKGASHTPQKTFLPKIFNQTTATVYDPKLSVSGEPLKPARDIRVKLIADGRIQDKSLTQLVTHFLVLLASDMVTTSDTSNYVSQRPFCCEEAGKSDIMCAPNLIPQDDYVHRFSNIKCLNMTRPLTFQTSGCLPNTTEPSRIVKATPAFDLSPVYGNVVEPARRTYINGTLATEIVDGRVFPKTIGSLLLGVNFIPIIFFWRYHNFIARNLLEVNPCWSDNQTFNAAREINIASGCQTFYYELMPQLMAPDNLTADGIIANSTGFRDIYNSSLYPEVASDSIMAFRHFHKMQDGILRFYDSNGTFINVTFPMVDLASNLSYIKKNGNFDYVMEGCFRDATGKADDHIADPDILNRGLGGLQKSTDIMTNDLAKNRYFGLGSYIEYRKYCFGDNITSFDDLIGIIDPEMIESLKDLYNSVADVDLLAGTWVEKIMPGWYVPPTVYCLISKQLHHNVKSDRYWYERKERPNAFTAAQLAQIRKVTVARIMCDIGDTVSKIQPNAFLLPGTCNEIVSCDDIPQINYSAWADSTCTNSNNTTSTTTDDE